MLGDPRDERARLLGEPAIVDERVRAHEHADALRRCVPHDADGDARDGRIEERRALDRVLELGVDHARGAARARRDGRRAVAELDEAAHGPARLHAEDDLIGDGLLDEAGRGGEVVRRELLDDLALGAVEGDGAEARLGAARVQRDDEVRGRDRRRVGRGGRRERVARLPRREHERLDDGPPEHAARQEARDLDPRRGVARIDLARDLERGQADVGAHSTRRVAERAAVDDGAQLVDRLGRLAAEDYLAVDGHHGRRLERRSALLRGDDEHGAARAPREARAAEPRAAAALVEARQHGG